MKNLTLANPAALLALVLAAGAPMAHAAQALTRKNDCMTCHGIDR